MWLYVCVCVSEQMSARVYTIILSQTQLFPTPITHTRTHTHTQFYLRIVRPHLRRGKHGGLTILQPVRSRGTHTGLLDVGDGLGVVDGVTYTACLRKDLAEDEAGVFDAAVGALIVCVCVCVCL